MTNTQAWYIVKEKDGTCQILETTKEAIPESAQHWGPFPDHQEAIARRVGLIRAGKCQPV
jgi:hypothetical protein